MIWRDSFSDGGEKHRSPEKKIKRERDTATLNFLKEEDLRLSKAIWGSTIVTSINIVVNSIIQKVN